MVKDLISGYLQIFITLNLVLNTPRDNPHCSLFSRDTKSLVAGTNFIGFLLTKATSYL